MNHINHSNPLNYLKQQYPSSGCFDFVEMAMKYSGNNPSFDYDLAVEIEKCKAEYEERDWHHDQLDFWIEQIDRQLGWIE